MYRPVRRGNGSSKCFSLPRCLPQRKIPRREEGLSNWFNVLGVTRWQLSCFGGGWIKGPIIRAGCLWLYFNLGGPAWESHVINQNRTCPLDIIFALRSRIGESRLRAVAENLPSAFITEAKALSHGVRGQDQPLPLGISDLPTLLLSTTRTGAYGCLYRPSCFLPPQ